MALCVWPIEFFFIVRAVDAEGVPSEQANLLRTSKHQKCPTGEVRFDLACSDVVRTSTSEKFKKFSTVHFLVPSGHDAC